MSYGFFTFSDDHDDNEDSVLPSIHKSIMNSFSPNSHLRKAVTTMSTSNAQSVNSNCTWQHLNSEPPASKRQDCQSSFLAGTFGSNIMPSDLAKMETTGFFQKTKSPTSVADLADLATVVNESATSSKRGRHIASGQYNKLQYIEASSWW